MRTVIKKIKVYKYDELSDDAKFKAISGFIEQILDVESALGYADHPDFKSAVEEAERLQTPWFTGQIIYEKMKETLEEDFRINEYEYTEDGKMY